MVPLLSKKKERREGKGHIPHASREETDSLRQTRLQAYYYSSSNTNTSQREAPRLTAGGAISD